MKKRIAASILAAAMAASVLTACSGDNTASADGSAAGGTTAGESAESSAASQASGVITDGFADVDTNGVTVSFWHAMGGVNGEAMDYLVNKFNEENTDGITVEAVYQGSYDDTINKLKFKCWYYDTAVSAGTEEVVKNLPDEEIPKEFRKYKL